MVIITLSDVLGISIFVLAIIGTVLCILFKLLNCKYKEKSRKWNNCFDCKHYYCKGVASVGGISYDKCRITGIEDTHDFNDSEEYRKCKNFEKR